MLLLIQQVLRMFSYFIFCNIRIKQNLFSFKSFRNTSIIITVDLSKLQEAWITLETIIDYLRTRIRECVKTASKENSRVKEKIKSLIDQRIGENPVSNPYLANGLEENL